MSARPIDETGNDLVAAGAVLALFARDRNPALQAISLVVDEHGQPTNQIDISLSFLRSTYRLTVERVPE